MVAITVILAAVIGAFVLEIGDQQETAPSTSFDTEQRDRLFKSQGYKNNGCYQGGEAANCMNATQVGISHAGGDTIDVSTFEIVVDGNSTVYQEEGYIGNEAIVNPAPDFTASLGTNQQTEFKSGKSMRPYIVGGTPDGEDMAGWIKGNPGRALTSDQWITSDGKFEAFYSKKDMGDDGAVIVPPSEPKGWGNTLQQGNNVDVVWEASSGGKTQTLMTYTVQ
jgi:hypothetical protein